MPFEDNSFDIIQFSAVAHEVSSYGIALDKQIRLYGMPAVESAFMELHRVLRPNGVLCYRDVLCPSNRREIEIRTYRGDGAIAFVLLMLPFIQGAQAYDILYGCLPVSYQRINRSLLMLEAPIGIHREIQRHFICFFSLLKQFGLIGPPYNRAKFDVVIPELLNHSPLRPEISGWLNREGGELYCYSTLDDLGRFTSFKMKALNALGPSFYVDRAFWSVNREYNHLLSEIVDLPELEGKQFALFRKVGVLQ